MTGQDPYVDLTASLGEEIEAVFASAGVTVLKRMTAPIHTIRDWEPEREADIPILAQSFKISKTNFKEQILDFVKSQDTKVFSLYVALGYNFVPGVGERINPTTLLVGAPMTDEECAEMNDKLILRCYVSKGFPPDVEAEQPFVVQSNLD